MTQAAQMPETTHIPMTFRPRGGKTVIVLPDGSRGLVRREATIDNTMIKLIARGYRWHRLLSSGAYTSIDELAAAEKIKGSHVCRILRPAHLAPSIVEAILEGRHAPHLTIKDLMKPFPMDWREQENNLLATQKLL